MPASPRAFFDALAARGAHPAVIDATGPGQARTIAYGELVHRARVLAAALASRGARSGDRVTALLPNGMDFAVLYAACLYGGFTAVPLNASLPDAVLRYVIEVTRPSICVTDARSADRVGGLGITAPWVLPGPGALLAIEPAELEAPPSASDPRRLLAITFTSGTTSMPKGVCHVAGAMLANVVAFNTLVGFGADARMLHVMPMAYMAGFLNTLLGPLAAGATVVLAPPFGAAAALRFWRPAMDHGIDSMWLSPTMLAYLSRINRGDEVGAWTRAHLAQVFVGTAPLPRAVGRAFEGTFGCPTLESYGMTEVLLVSGNRRGGPRPEGSVGEILPGVEVESRAADGALLRAGQDGELWIRTPYALAGYLDPATGAPAPHPQDGWLATGDIGHTDAQGCLFITGRLKDLIIHGGMNVSPRAIEELLVRCPGVLDAAVVGLPDPFWGEEVVAFVQMEPGGVLEALEPGWAARCRAELPADAVPSRFIARSEFPRTSTGKVQKGVLRSELLAPAASDVQSQLPTSNTGPNA